MPAKRNTSQLIDLSFLWRMSGYTKRNYTSFLRSLRHYLFGATDYRMTERRCQQFFADESNFEQDDSRILYNG